MPNQPTLWRRSYTRGAAAFWTRHVPAMEQLYPDDRAGNRARRAFLASLPVLPPLIHNGKKPRK